MPVNGNGRSAMVGLGLLLSAIVFWYLESTTTNPVMSLIYVGGNVLCTLAMCSKFGAALGVDHGLAKFTDQVMSIVPWAAMYFLVLQALHYNRDGMDGFMANASITAGLILVAFGAADSIAAWFGTKYKQATDAASEIKNRADAARDALAGGRHS